MNKLAERPKYSDRETLTRAVDKIIPEVLNWLQDGSTAEDIREDLLAVSSYPDDGYELCRKLDSYHHWQVNAQLVEIMDGMSHYKHTALEDREKEWIAAEGIKPKYGVGNTVEFPREDEVCSGKVYRVEVDVGKYVVFCPQLGHVEIGPGTHGVYINFEDVKPAPTEAENKHGG